jgi:phosphoglycerate dehydrogenase-like enzyme
VAKPPVIVVEDDPFTRLIPIVLDPSSSEERRAAFADFMAHDEPDFDGWVKRVRAGSPGLYPSEVRMVTSQAEMRAALKDAVAVVTESLHVGADDIGAGPVLKVVQKFGLGLRNVDTAACAERNVKVLTLRRRANIACAEHAFALMLALARKLETVSGLVTKARIEALGSPIRPFDRRHTPGANYPRVGGLRMLNESTLGIVGLGEIGREIALRAKGFGMRALYHQRTHVAEAEERELDIRYVPLATLMAESDWIVPQVPTAISTRDLIGRDVLAHVKPGACIVNVSNPLVIDRDAVIAALKSGRLGGFALDVQYQEPLPADDELLRLPNVILTPRMAGSPRHNGLNDFEELITTLAREMT